MDDVNESGYKIQPEFQEYAKDPLLDLDITDSTELWLIQSATNQVLDFDGQEVSVDLSHNGVLGTFEGSLNTGESYIIDHSAHDVDTTVFLPSRSVPKIAGKIDRLVTFVQYTDPSKVPDEDTERLLMEKSSTLTKTNRTRSSRPTSTLTYGSGRKSSLSEKVSSKSASKRHREKSMTSEQTAQRLERSHDKNSKRK